MFITQGFLEAVASSNDYAKTWRHERIANHKSIFNIVLDPGNQIPAFLCVNNNVSCLPSFCAGMPRCLFPNDRDSKVVAMPYAPYPARWFPVARHGN